MLLARIDRIKHHGQVTLSDLPGYPLLGVLKMCLLASLKFDGYANTPLFRTKIW